MKVRRILKDHFIPHEGNAYQPHFLRLKVVLALLLMVLVLEGSYLLGTTFILPRSDNFAAIFASVLVEQTNGERNKDSLRELAVNATLEKAAQLKANDMAEKGYFAHNTPDGKTPWYFFREAGYDYAAAGENLAVNFIDSRDVTDSWMRSPTHRANILNGNYTEIGIATAVGTYKGKSAIFVVQEFGRPSQVARDIPGATTSASNLLAAVSSTPTAEVSPNIAGAQDKKETNPIVVVEKIAQVTSTPPPKPMTKLDVVDAEVDMPVAPVESVAGTETRKLDIPASATMTTSILNDDPRAVIAPATAFVQPSIIEKMIASPRSFITNILLLLAALLTVALGLAVFIKIRIQYPHMIANAVLLIAIILAIVLLNFALGFTRGVI